MILKPLAQSPSPKSTCCVDWVLWTLERQSLLQGHLPAKLQPDFMNRLCHLHARGSLCLTLSTSHEPGVPQASSFQLSKLRQQPHWLIQRERTERQSIYLVLFCEKIILDLHREPIRYFSLSKSFLFKILLSWISPNIYVHENMCAGHADVSYDAIYPWNSRLYHLHAQYIQPYRASVPTQIRGTGAVSFVLDRWKFLKLNGTDFQRKWLLELNSEDPHRHHSITQVTMQLNSRLINKKRQNKSKLVKKILRCSKFNLRELMDQWVKRESFIFLLHIIYWDFKTETYNFSLIPSSWMRMQTSHWY